MTSSTRAAGVVAASAVVAVVATPRAAAAAPSPLAYETPAGEECPAESELRDALAARLGRDPFAEPAPVPAPRIAIAIRARGRDLVASIRWAREVGPSVERTLTGAPGQCAELVRAVAVTVAVMLDPLGDLAPKDGASPAAPLPPASNDRVVSVRPSISQPRVDEGSAPPSPEPRPHEVKAPTVARSTLRGELGAATNLGLFPDLGLAARVGLALAYPRWSIGAEGQLAASPGAAEVGGQRVNAGLASLGLTACAHPWRLATCLGASAGSYSARADAVVDPTTKRRLWAGLAVRVGAPIRVGESLRLVPFVEATVPVLRRNLEVDGRAVWEAPPVAGALGISAQADFL